MTLYAVRNRDTGEEVLRYSSALPDDSLLPGPDFDHVEILDLPVRPEVMLTQLDVLRRMTDQECAAVFTAAKQSVLVEVWLEKFRSASVLNSWDPLLMQGFAAPEAMGLISPGRAQEILNG